MDKKDIDLALPAGPTSGLSISDPATPRAPDYPTLHLDGKEELHLPKSGQITFDYRLISETSSEDKAGNHRYQCTLEIRKLCDVSGEKDTRPSKRDTSAEDSLDAMMKEKQKAAESADESDEY